MIYLDVISKINAELKHASGLDLPCLAGKAEEVRSRNSEVRSPKPEVRSQKSEVGTRKSEVALLGHRRGGGAYIWNEVSDGTCGVPTSFPGLQAYFRGGGLYLGGLYSGGGAYIRRFTVCAFL
jgi:hypothetical protein